MNLCSSICILMETVVLSVGGSLVAPQGGIDAGFIERLVTLVKRHRSKRFVLVVGGGAVCRQYQGAAKQVARPDSGDLDWIGIMATRLNAELVRVSFGNLAHSTVITDPSRPIRTKKRVVVAAGWKPGWSSDYDAVYLCKKLKGRTVINLTNVDYVYDRDPKDPAAQRFERIGWPQFRKLVGSRWNPGLNVPFDPIASRLAQAAKVRVIIANGGNLKNLDALLGGKQFKGTTIE